MTGPFREPAQQRPPVKLPSRARAATLALVSTAALLLSAALATAGATEDSAPRFIGLRVGFADRYKVGHWTPMVFRIRGGDQAVTGVVELTLPDGDGVPSRVTSRKPVRLEAGVETEVTLYAKPGRVDGTLTVTLWPDKDDRGEPLARASFDAAPRADSRHHRTALRATRELVVCVGPSIGIESAVDWLRGSQRVPSEAKIEVATLEDFDHLPEHWLGYDTVDTVVLSTSRSEPDAGLKLDDARIAALERFVQLGGKLVLCVGEAAPELLEDDGPLARFAPGPYERMVPPPSFSGLESYSESTIPVPHRGALGPERRIQSPLIRVQEGKVEVRDGELALIVRRPFVFGQITFVALDLDRPPFADWKGRRNLLAKLLGHPASGVEARQEFPLRTGLVSETGFNDLSGQMRAAIDQFPAVGIVPFWLVAMLAFLYIVLIGPVDYYLVRFLLARRVLKRVGWAWVTFLAMVILVSVGAYLMARQIKGDQIHVNHVHVIDVDDQSGLVRGTSWVNIFSPTTKTYDLTIEPGLPSGANSGDGEVVLAWLGLPGTGLGGMSSVVATTSLWDRPYHFNSNASAIRNVPIPVWSTKGFQSRWWLPGAAGSGGLEASLATRAERFLEGTLQNRLDVPIEECLLAYDRWAYRLDRMEPGETVRIGTLSQAHTLQTELTGRRLGTHEEVQPYDPFALDIPPIVRQMMFHRAAGGSGYTGLLNRYVADLDLSAHLEIGRAIFVARLPEPVVRVKLDGEPVGDRHWTFLRVVIPVEAARSVARP